MIHKSREFDTEPKNYEDVETKNINIKKEKMEERMFYPMSCYVGDRLEMVKQIFLTLKPKTIRNLAPEHIREYDMEFIEELVLNELMCISNKRLRTIINGTSCLTDTDTSDDSDIEAKAQHVSLEEISSDSDIEASNTCNVHKSKTKYNKNEINGENSHISILELLELQARARAIRSQLAMEPVTKIEVDPDAKHFKSSNAVVLANSDPSSMSISCSLTDSAKGQTHVEANNINTNVNLAETQNQEIGKRIKLQRLFRKKIEEEVVTGQRSKEKSEREKFSPDVIPIVSEPEIWVIDSTDDEQENKSIMNPENKLSSYEAEEGEILEIELEGGTKENEGSNVYRKNDTVEDGENKESRVSGIKTTLHLEENNERESVYCENTITRNLFGYGDGSMTTIKNTYKVLNEYIDDKSTPTGATTEDKIDGIQGRCEEAGKTYLPSLSDEDDIISLEGGDLEMIDIDENIQSTNSNQISQKVEVGNVIYPNSSNNASNKVISSWSDRYLKSIKVNNVLRTSRLNKKVREKLKAIKMKNKFQPKEPVEKATQGAKMRDEKPEECMDNAEDGT